MVVDETPNALAEIVCLRQVLAIRTFALKQVRDRVDANAIDPPIDPEGSDLENFILDGGIVVIQVRLMTVETVPVIALATVSQLQLESCVSLKMTRVPRYSSAVSLQT